MKTIKNRKLHGSVLLTVVCVMSLLIIFLFGTLALATANNNRAHVNYSTAQTSITSRTIVESTLKAMAADDSFGSVVNALDDGSSPLKVPVNLDVNASNAGALGHIDDVTIEYAGKKKFYFTEDNKWDDRDLLKITAKVRLGGTDSTTSAYIVKNPPNEDTTVSGGAGFITTGGASFTTGSVLFGGSYINMPPTSVVDTFDYKYSTTNPGKEGYLYSGTDSPFRITDNKFVVEADLVIWGNMEPDKMNYLVFPGSGKGVTVWGNMIFETSGSGTNLSVVNNTPTGEYDFKDIPYIYIDQKVYVGKEGGQGIVRLGSVKPGAEGGALHNAQKSDKPLNIFARQIDLPNATDVFLGGDVYLMDANVKNVITPNNADSSLYNWSSSVINKYDSDVGVPHVGGNLYSKGDLKLSKMKIEGGVYCEGDLELGPQVEINGDLACRGTLTINGRVDVKGNHDVYVSTLPTVSGDLYINGVKYSEEDGMASLKSGYSYQPNIRDSEFDDENFYKLDNVESTYTVEEVDHGTWIEKVVKDASGNRTYQVWDGDEQKHVDSLDADTIRSLVYYRRVNGDGDITNEATGDSESIFRKSDKQRVNESDASRYFYLRVDVDGDPIEPEDRIPYIDENDFTYFDAMGNQVNASEAFENKALGDVGMLPYVYPPYAERDVILGLGELTTSSGVKLSTSETQVVKRLNQLYQTINPYSSTVLPTEERQILEKIALGENDPTTGQPFPTFDSVESIYNSCHTVATSLKNDGTVEYATGDYKGSSPDGAPVITKSCILTGSSMSAAEQYKYINGMRAIVFKPETNLVVVLDDYTLDSDYFFLVDDTLGGSVYFYVPGDRDIAGSKEDVTNGVTGNNATHDAVKDLGASTVKVQEGIRTTSYNILIKSNEDFQLTTSSNYKVSDDLTKVYEESERDPMIHYNSAGQIDPPLIEQMHKVLGLKNKLGKPKAYLYGGDNSAINMQNAKIQSVNIISSELKVHINCENANFWNDHTVWYNGTKLSDVKQGNPPGVLGCFNAQLGGSDQTITSLYVQGGSGDGGDDTEDVDGIRYKILYYDEY